jgi:hypothetical protein
MPRRSENLDAGGPLSLSNVHQEAHAERPNCPAGVRDEPIDNVSD